MGYEPLPVKAPRLTGTPLRLLAAMLESPLWSRLLAPKLMRDVGLGALRAFRTEAPPTLHPLVKPRDEDLLPARLGLGDLPALAAELAPSAPVSARRPGVLDYARAYQEGRLNPAAVASAVIRAIRDSNEREPPLRAFFSSDDTDLQKQATASTARWQSGRPLSLFDGVPVAIKDELDMLPYRGTGGTRVLSRVPTADAVVVARLRAAGALLVGKTTMHEIGLGVTGINPVTGIARNPWNLEHAAGGSSSGSGSAVGAGIVPVAMGADGGGSIRIPAALNGVVGLKPTFGRVSEGGSLQLCWSVGHIGPIAASALDCALAYVVTSGLDPEERARERPALPLHDPPVHLTGLSRGRLDGVRLGVYWKWFRHSRSQVADACEVMLRHLEEQGAKVVPVEIPHLEPLRLAHAASIAPEIATAVESLYDTGKHKGLSPETRINLALARLTSSLDYIKAQRVRTVCIDAFEAAFEQVDVIITPTTACTAPAIRADAVSQGESDLAVLSELMRFAVAGNFTGLPAISFPAGHDSAGLPIGIQAMGRWWQEHLLLRLALVAEDAVPPRRAPLFYDTLGG